LLVDISKVKLLKGNSTSKTNRKWALGWLTGGSGVCAAVCVPGVCATSENQFFHSGGDSGETVRERETPVCLYWSHSTHLPSQVTVSFVLSIKTVCGCLGPPLTFSDLAAPYLALILGSLMVARLVPVMVNMVPPLKKEIRGLIVQKIRTNSYTIALEQ